MRVNAEPHLSGSVGATRDRRAHIAPLLQNPSYPNWSSLPPLPLPPPTPPLPPPHQQTLTLPSNFGGRLINNGGLQLTDAPNAVYYRFITLVRRPHGGSAAPPRRQNKQTLAGKNGGDTAACVPGSGTSRRLRTQNSRRLLAERYTDDGSRTDQEGFALAPSLAA